MGPRLSQKPRVFSTPSPPVGLCVRVAGALGFGLPVRASPSPRRSDAPAPARPAAPAAGRAGPRPGPGARPGGAGPPRRPPPARPRRRPPRPRCRSSACGSALGGPDGATASLVVRPLPSLRLPRRAGLELPRVGRAGRRRRHALPLGRLAGPGGLLRPLLRRRPEQGRQGHPRRAAAAGLQTSATTTSTARSASSSARRAASPSRSGSGSPTSGATSTGTATTVQNPGTPDEATVTVVNPSLRAVIPSLRLGMLFYF